MELFEYIKSQLPQMPNVAIMKDMGASDELVEYVKESPENTNLNILNVYYENSNLGTLIINTTINSTELSFTSDALIEVGAHPELYEIIVDDGGIIKILDNSSIEDESNYIWFYHGDDPGTIFFEENSSNGYYSALSYFPSEEAIEEQQREEHTIKIYIREK